MSRSCCVCARPELAEDPSSELRPYGPGGQLICFPCAMKPEHKDEMERNFHRQFDAAEEASRSGGSGIAGVILTKDGPKPVAGS